MFLMSYSINWQNVIIWFTLLLETLGNMCIAIVFFPSCDVTNFEINLISLDQATFLREKKLSQT